MEGVVLGLHKDNWHDTGAAVVLPDNHGRRKVAHVSQERLDRRKHSRAFPNEATFECLREMGVPSIDDVELVVLDHTMNSADWRLDYRRNLCRTDVFLDAIPHDKISIISHHLCHAAASFFTSPFEEAAILVVDGRGSKVEGPDTGFETQTLWHGSQNSIELIELSDCCGIGLLYEAVSQVIGFGFLEAGKTMGLAPFGRDAGPPLVDFTTSFQGMRSDYGHICDIDNTFFPVLPKLTDVHRRRLAFDVQREAERVMFHLATVARKRTGLPNLCMGGGVALNSVANGKLLRSGLFDRIFINPACSDSGLPLGAALWGYHARLGYPRDRQPLSPYIGPTYDDARIAKAAEVGHKILREGHLQRAADLLKADKVVATFQGRSEMGPRALGNRSILMSPFKTDNREHLNRIVKRREPFRPFAPVVPLELAGRYFEIAEESPHMLTVADVRPEWRSRIPAVTHVDGTARLQTVTREQNPILYELLHVFGDLTGVPVLLNTSFNLAGEPLVETPEDAIACFRSTAIDALLFNKFLATKYA